MRRAYTFLVVFLSTTALLAAADNTLPKLLSQLPAPDAPAEQKLMTQLMSSGSEGIEALCLQLTPAGKGDDTQVRYALNGLSTFVNYAGTPKQHMTAFIKGVQTGLLKATDKEVQTFLISLLQTAASRDSIPVLSRFLNDSRLCEPAARALVQLGGSAATEALHHAFLNSSGKNQITLAQALGQNRAVSAAKDLRALFTRIPVTSQDGRVVARALANMADIQLKPVLQEALKTAQGLSKAQLYADLVLLAQRLIEQNNIKAGIEICNQLLDSSQTPENTACAALALLADTDKDSGLNRLIKVVQGDNVFLQCQAVNLAPKFPGNNATLQWIKVLPGCSPLLKTKIIAMLADRGDPVALKAIKNALTDTDSTVRLAAIEAAAKLGGPAIVSSLLTFAASNEDPAELQTVIRALMTISGNKVLSQTAASLHKLKPIGRQIFLAGMAYRRESQVFDTLLAYTHDNDRQVRKTAWKSLGQTAPAEKLPLLIDTLLKQTDSADQKAAIAAVTGAGELLNDYTSLINLLVDRLESAPSQQKKLLVSVLGQINHDTALQTLVLYTKDKNESVKDTAIRALAKWSTPQALQPLLDVIKNETRLTWQVLAFRQCMNLLATAKLDPEHKVKWYTQLVDTAPRPQEKQAARTELDKLVPVKSSDSDQKGLRPVPEGFCKLFNGTDLTNWKGLLFRPYDNPIKRRQLSPEELKKEQAKADADMHTHWKAQDGILYFDGKGHSLATVKQYRDFEMYVDWKIQPRGDSGIYLRGSPQVQIWDPKQWKIGSGGLYNNQKNPSKPSMIADKPTGQWNTFFIRMVQDRVWVTLNDHLVVDGVIMENYWDRSQPIFDMEQIELQCHGNPVEFRNIFIRQLPRPGVWNTLFNGKDLTGWTGDVKGYKIEEGAIVCRGGHNLFTFDEFDNFHLKFDFKLTPGANNGLGIRAPLKGDAAYVGMELQILDNSADKYKNLHDYQYHGSVYGVAPAKRGHQKPVGQWNHQEVIADGNHIKVILNGSVIVDTDISAPIKNGTMDKRDHSGLKNKSGHIGFLGHGDVVFFKNIEIMPLK